MTCGGPVSLWLLGGRVFVAVLLHPCLVHTKAEFVQYFRAEFCRGLGAC